MFWNTTKTIDILANDSDCENDSLTVSITTNPLHGTASINASRQLVYTPNTNYSGKDSLQYSLNDGHSTSVTSVVISIFSTSGVDELSENNFSVFPNPASSFLTVQTTINASYYIQVINLSGEVIEEVKAIKNATVLNAQPWSNGIYMLRFYSPENHFSFTKKIAVVR